MRKCLLAATASVVVMAAAGAVRAETVKLSLREAMARALSDGTTARLAIVKVDQARNQQLLAHSALMPHLDGSIQEANEEINLATFGFTLPGFPPVVGPFNLFDAHITAAMNVIATAARKRYHAAQKEVEVSDADRAATNNQVAAAVATLYVALQRARSQVDETQANVKLFERLVELAQHQLDAGVATKLDTTRAQVQLARQNQALLVAQNQADFARLSLLRAIGADLSDNVELTDSTLDQQHVIPDTATALALARRLRPELTAMAQQTEAVRLTLAAEKAERYPTLAVQAQGGYNGNNLNNTVWTRTFGALVSVPLWTGGAVSARVAEARSQLWQLQINRKDLEAQIEEEVRRALLNYRSAENRAFLAGQNVKLTTAELQFARDRFANGISNDIEVDNAQTAVTQASDARVTAAADQSQAWFDLLRATGQIRQLIEGKVE